MTSGSNGSGNDWASPGSPQPPPGWSSEQPPPAYAAPAQPAWGYGAPPPPRPGIIPLRPLGVGELLDGSFTAIRRYPRATLGLAACVMLVITVVQVLVQWYLLGGLEPPADGETLSEAADYLARVGTALSLSLVVTAVGTLLLTGLITAVIGEAVLGRAVTAGDAWRRLKPLFWRLVGVTVLTFLIMTGVGVAAVVPGFVVLAIGSNGGGTAVLVIGLIAGVLLGVWLYISLALAPAAVVLERQTVRGALRRSRALVRGSWWRVFGILLLAAILASVVGGIINLPFGLAGGGLTSLGDNESDLQFSQLVISGLGGILSGTIVRPFSAGVAALLYIDRRIRAEALDLALARAAAEPTPPSS
jgi:hypothetical protein